MLKRLKSFLFKMVLILLIAPVVLVGVVKYVDPPIWGWKLSRIVVPPKNYPDSSQHEWVSLSRISKNMQLAVIATEDQKFPHHYGVDFESLFDVISEADDNGPSRGASTITQQAAKNVFLFPSHSYARKAYELYFALLMELMWSKERILEVYLNVVEFGPGIYGAEAAAQNYFGVSAKQLSKWQAARLAVVLPNPYRIKVYPQSDYTARRTRWAMNQMSNLGSVQL
ncbi:monofunctional biosynthetic peptidoglycan transglycosylase [Vibrio diabolicus]|uniref:monofunctional biosynthetic peptidoglycan transglycosylase n=1 Tax=Vibrio diabolicus TaxID=50719 RepID=UPI00062E71D0|nr:monofunctional biosynthetic peptidoglycan transglycosylase [Vibrio diabolicus]KOY45378.1 peptidoglycan transglycosylase [Vibrio parahaemolyticus]KLE23620.1 peptidoglycan transglycosylase [Vibrio diabolicus]MCQ9064645.1 monofunctional biosynthetic peptidoglycan transglycosylase [Vibrio diabolicus]MCR9470598.1 monofunctional biosynthetic peptidoglycan transglycosylase [Vibrio diabolicus]MCS0313024.1 monofunctional biosynthetic peptidoglycan transglycosylase [Vibrio diabolicus]